MAVELVRTFFLSQGMKWQGAFLSSGAAGLCCQGGVQPGGAEPQNQGLCVAEAGAWTAVNGMTARNASALDRMAEPLFRRFQIGIETGGDAARIRQRIPR